jgi:hypothetical protein
MAVCGDRTYGIATLVWAVVTLRRNLARARGFAGQGRHLFAMPRRVAAF